MIFEIFVGDLVFGSLYASAHGNAGLVNRIGVTRNQRMPPIEITTFRYQAITAAWRQPVQRAHIGRRQPDAVRNLFGTVLIILAGAKACIQKFAGNVSEIDFAGVFVLKLLEATAGTAIAPAFRFR